MDQSIYLILGVVIAGFIAVIFVMRKSLAKPPQDETSKLMLDYVKSLKEGTESSRKEIESKIAQSDEKINNRLTEAARMFADVQKKVGEMTELGRGMKDIQDLLKGPKLRGGMGEESLEMLLKQVLPAQHYQMQYRFNSGEVVDCIIRINKEILCIDSKFPLENFRAMIKSDKEDDQLAFRKAFFKDVKKHIDAIAKKYILPNEGTMDNALMYVPMESVFREINDEQDVQDYARSKKILITSPNSFYHHLTVINNSLRGAQINEMAKQLLRMVSAIKQDSDKFINNLSVLTKHITNAKNVTDLVNEDYRKLAGKIENAYDLQLDAPAEALAEVGGKKVAAPIPGRASPVEDGRDESQANIEKLL